jgi:V8-like Glu-specific endopeptidase
MASRHQVSHEAVSEEPMTLLQAMRRWPRDAIADFAFPQPRRPKSVILPRASDRSKLVRITKPGLPAQRDITALPDGVRRPRLQLRAAGRRVNPLFIYPPDNRSTFTDTTYPWRCCGRVVTPAGQGSGTIVGPQHVLTASHVIDWTETNGQIGWLRFEPDFNNGDTFAPSMATITYSYEHLSQVNGEYDVAEDYVVCVMDRRIGDELGWLGTTTYDDNWDGGNYWMHVGYPADIGGAQQPVFEGGFSIANSWAPGFFESGSGLDMETFASLTHGDSGGPIFGNFSDGPHVVGVVSAEGTLDPVVTDLSSRTGNWVAGGHEMPDLVSQARSEHP